MNAFDKIIGYKSIKRELLQICDMICNRTIYEKMGARLPHGVLLYGDPGLGKTLLAKCFIEECGLSSITVRRDKGGDAFVDSITQAFAKAKAEAPSLIFLDDMDKFANEDSSHSDAPEYVAVQAGIDGVKEADVLVIATVNEVRKLPDSLRRSGRFDRKIAVQAPTAADAEAIIAYYLKSKRVSDDIDMIDLTKMMNYRSCAELETILNEAAVRAAFARKESIEMADIISVVLKQQYGAQEDIPHVSDKVLEKVALHEAGHLVVSEILCPGSVGFASLLPSEENHCGGFIHNCKALPNFYEAIIGMGGKAAVEMRYAGRIANGCAGDMKDSAKRIRDAADKEGHLGFSLLDVESPSSAGMSESLNARTEEAVQRELEQCYRTAQSILAANQAFVEKITEAFLEKKTLLYSDIQSIRRAFPKGKPEADFAAISLYDSLEEPQAEESKAENSIESLKRQLEKRARERLPCM